MEDLSIAEGITHPLGFQRLWEGCRRSVDGFEVVPIYCPVEEAKELLSCHLSHPCALLPLLEAGDAERFTVSWCFAFELIGAVFKDWEIEGLPSAVTSVWDELAIFLDQCVDVDLLPAAGGVGALGSFLEGDGVTVAKTLGDLLNTRQSEGSPSFRPLVGEALSSADRQRCGLLGGSS